MSKLPILNFHGIQAFEGEYSWSRGERPYVVDSSIFDTELSLISDKDFSSLSLKELSDWQKNSDSSKRIMLTFDDGHASHFIHAAPLLKEKKLKAIFFIPPALVGKPEQMTYLEIKELAKQGFEVGAHGLSHIALTNLSDAKLHNELTASKEILEDELGIEIISFSAPLGFYSSRVREAAKKIGYQYVFTSDFDLNSKNADLLSLKRLAVLESTTLEKFEALIEGKLGTKKYIEFLKTKARGILGPSGYEKISELKSFCSPNLSSASSSKENYL